MYLFDFFRKFNIKRETQNQDYPHLFDRNGQIIESNLRDYEKKLEEKAYSLLKRRFAVYGFFFGILIGSGVISWNAIKSDVKKNVVESLTNDESLKNKIIDKTTVELDEISELKKKAQLIIEDIREDRTAANELLKNNMEEILLMLNKIDSLAKY